MAESIESNTISVSEINWNKLSPAEFSALEHKAQAEQKIIKLANKKPRTNGMVILKLNGKSFPVKESIALRLKAMKSQASKDKLIRQIIETTQPLIEL